MNIISEFEEEEIIRQNKRRIIEKNVNTNIMHSFDAHGIKFTVPVKYELIKVLG